MKRYDDTNMTSFASSYDIDNPSDAIPMSEVYDVQFCSAQRNKQV